MNTEPGPVIWLRFFFFEADMATVIDKAALINRALTQIGVGPVFSIDDGSDLAEICEQAWLSCVDHTFGLDDWEFAKLTKRNNRHAATPENGWTYGFDLPAGRIGEPLKIMDQAGHSPRPLRHFAIEGGKLYCNASETWSVCKFVTDPESWPPPWRVAFEKALCGYLAMPVWEDEQLRDTSFADAFGSRSQQGTGGMFGRLMAQNKAAQPIGEPMGNDSPLTDVRPTGAALPWYGNQ